MEKNNIQKYLEPFCGALVVAKYMCKYDIKCYCNDQSKKLIDLLKLVQTNIFINPKINKKWIELKNSQMFDEPNINAQKTFVGYVCSFGDYIFPLNLFKHDISKITFLNNDYIDLDASKGWFLIYCDPPYYNTDNSPYKRKKK